MPIGTGEDRANKFGLIFESTLHNGKFRNRVAVEHLVEGGELYLYAFLHASAGDLKAPKLRSISCQLRVGWSV